VTDFALSKWYLDVISADGLAFIGYAANLRWGTLRVNYASVLLARVGEASPTTRMTLVTGALPAEHGRQLAWRSESLGVSGAWQALDEPITRTLYTCVDGAVHWDCRMPRANARVEVGDIVVEGLGYVERVDLTLKPWRMPIRELRWGRALAHDDGIVWVDWRGDSERPHDIRIVQRSSGRLGPCTVDDHGIELDGTPMLQLDVGTPLRRGSLGVNVLQAMPRSITRRLPKFITEMHEHKTLCRAKLHEKNAWCIHEVVKFP
jgi:hypothetical protein